MKKLLTISLTLLILSGSALAQGDGGFAAPFLRLGLGARAISMGSAHVAVADDGFAGYYNAAGLTYLENRYLTTSYSFLPLDRLYHFVSYSQNLQPTAGLSLYWLSTGVDNIDGRDLSGNQTGDLSERGNVFGLAFANRFHRRVSVGISLKVIQHILDLVDESLDASDLLFDIGLLVKPVDRLRIGVQVKDYGGGLTYDTQDLFDQGGSSTDEVPFIVNVGAAYDYSPSLLIAGSVSFNEQQEERVSFGVEYTNTLGYAIRAGTEDTRFSAGAGYNFNLKDGLDSQLDYSLAIGRIGEGETHIFSWIFVF